VNRAARRKVAKVLRAFRKKAGFTTTQIAYELGWTVDFYECAEAAEVGLSAGQQNDVRRVMLAAHKAAAIRDRLRAPLRPRRRLP
jgi:hypothetical protein